ncbi:hypothetical protein FACS189429_4370 [Bacteroidia bacterium]|nr:hypothetical protein FACS189429_4370 [Bacteroidia bacterium]
MLRDKITKNISEITNDFSKNKLDGVNVLRSFRALKLTERFSEFKNIKRCGYNFQIILSALIWIVTQKEKTVNSSLSALSEMGICCGKDAYYRLKNKENICWRIASCFLKETEVNKTEETVFKKKKRCLIFDDTLLEKTGKAVVKSWRQSVKQF